ncbi:putative gustatory receptor 28b [Chelonus insularis]|uniref:putative gustatory receptor 28b n=1 Tax=Chelonus insularis TaxID=460826 RepID=UPI00158E8457|nr:putative gustatory receptor 28b [Chelonus insularis]
MFKQFYLISLLTCSVTNLMSEMKKTSDIVYRLVGNFFTQITVKRQLEQFSIELLHRKSLCFTACGLFRLDNSLLTSVARVISTNMVLLIEYQFYEQFKTINNNST